MRKFRFVEGRNCWRVAHADRLAVLVDGESYFRAVRHALLAARRRIVILAWDIHSQVELVREASDDDLPTALADLILAVLDRRPNLEVFVLLWSYSPIYALEREPLFVGDTVAAARSVIGWVGQMLSGDEAIETLYPCCYNAGC
jgi:phosphatidylserine/phosphatidylglycerophosphate/cardiolipin synthase-like enzyme